MIEILELVKIFAKSEKEQETYFPILKSPVWLTYGVFDFSTDSARFVALCLLCEESKKAAAWAEPIGQISAEIFSLTTLLIEVSGLYPWLVYHPALVRQDDGALDPAIYGTWDVLRRLCTLAYNTNGNNYSVRAFWELVGAYTRAVK